MLLFAGLGNPGAKYAGNRHNVGFRALDGIADRHGFSAWKSRDHALLSEGRIDGARLLLVKPQSFMNNSGGPLSSVARFFKVKAEHMYVFHDEVELPPGKIRVKKGGGHAGHNGLKDIDRHFGQEYWRVRIGVGRPQAASNSAEPAGGGAKPALSFLTFDYIKPAAQAKPVPMHDWVLGDFRASDHADWLDRLLDSMAREAGLLASGETNAFMSRITHLAPVPKSDKSE